MARNHWFLPRSVDVLGMLSEQAAVTVDGIAELVAWATGEAGAAERLGKLEHEADDYKRKLRANLTEAFSTPLEPEDIFELSSGIDEILNSAKNVVREAEAMDCAPDDATAEMATHLHHGTKRLATALTLFAQEDRDGATAEADHAVKDQRHLQHTYRSAMSALVDIDDVREIATRRELYRRLARTGDELVRVAERIWYSVLKES